MQEDFNKNNEGFEEKLSEELYGIKPSSRVGKIKKIWGIQKRKPEKLQPWEEFEFDVEYLTIFKKNIKKVFVAIFLLFLISASAFIYIFYYRAVYVRGVNLNILGVEEVNSLDEYEYAIKIENNSNYQLVDSKLEINLEKGVFFADDIEAEKKIINIGDLDLKTSREIRSRFFFIGNLNEIKKIKVAYIYYTPKRNQEYKTEKELIVSIKKEPLSLQIYSPSKVFVNEFFNFSIKLSNNTSKNLGFKVSVNFQGNYEADVVSPPYERKYEWTFNSISPNSSLEISMIGKYLKYVSNPAVYVDVNLIYLNRIFPLKTYSVGINILESPIVLEIESRPESNVVDLRLPITYVIRWTNKSSITLNNVKLKVNFEGPFDYETLRTDGYFDPYENSIIWDARNKPALANVSPGSFDYVTISIAPTKEYPIGKKDLELQIKATLETESIPPEVQILSKKLSIQTQLTKKIKGDINVVTELLYNDPQVKNTGPYPLVNGKPTTLSFYLKFYTYGEDFQNILVKTKIPIGVKLTGVVGGEFNYNKLQYNAETGDFVYQIDEISVGHGSIYGPYSIMFQIEVTPPLIGNINNLVIIPPIEISAQGKFSGESFKIKTNELQPFNIGYPFKY